MSYQRVLTPFTQRSGCIGPVEIVVIVAQPLVCIAGCRGFQPQHRDDLFVVKVVGKSFCLGLGSHEAEIKLKGSRVKSRKRNSACHWPPTHIVAINSKQPQTRWSSRIRSRLNLFLHTFNATIEIVLVFQSSLIFAIIPGIFTK